MAVACAMPTIPDVVPVAAFAAREAPVTVASTWSRLAVLPFDV